jgi:hypothetical protein
MWERLLNLFKDQQIDESSIDEETESLQSIEPVQEASTNITPIKTHSKGTYNGPGRLIGFNYLKRRGEDESNNPPRKFINLANLLRGKFGNG